MKNKLIAWLLVVVMLCLSLSGCAFNYQKQDFSEYVSYDADALYAALTALTIEDFGFTKDEDTRTAKVTDEIRNRIVKILDGEDAVSTGVIADGNLVSYCYYITATFGEGEAAETVTLYAANMAANKATSLSIYNLEKINDQIGDLLIGYDFDADGKYETETSTSKTATAGSVVYVTYAYQTGSEAKKTVTNERIELPGEANDTTFAGKLVGKSLATEFAKGTSSDEYVVIDGTTYSNIKINWQVTSGKELTLATTENPFADTTTKTNDTTGTSRTLKDAKDVTYHIYPVSRTEVPALSASVIIVDILADTIAKDTLSCFTSADYKYDQEGSSVTLKSIIEDLVKRYKDAADAKTAYDKDKSDANKEKLDAAEAKVNDTELAAIMAQIEQCNKTTGEGDAATTTSATETIVTEYKDLVYDELEEAYNGEIKEKVAHELWHELSEAVTVNGTPKRAVKEAYKVNYESYKYEFYEGKKSTTVTNKDHYGTLKIYITEGVAPELATEYGIEYPAEPTYEDAEKVLQRHAEEQVKEIMLVYIVADLINSKVADANLTVARAEVESYAYMQSVLSPYYYGVSLSQSQIIESHGENNIRTGLLFEKVLNFLMKTAEDDDSKFVNIELTVTPIANS